MEHEKAADKVFYICDGRACETCSSWMKEGCHHTSNIEHAAHFKKVFGHYKEEELVTAELKQTKVRKKPPKRRMATPRTSGRDV